MLNKMKENKNMIYLVLAIIAAALIAPTVVSMLAYQITENAICNLVYYAMLIAAAVVIAAFAGLKKACIVVPFLLVECADVFTDIVSIIQSESYASVFYGLVALAAVVLYFVAKKNNKLFSVVLIILLVQFGFAVAGTFAGSTISLARLIILAIITIELYLGNKEKNNEEV